MDKKFILIVIIALCSIFIFLTGYNLDKKHQLQVEKLDKYVKLYDKKKEMTYNIDSIKILDGVASIKGWAIVKDVYFINIKPTIVLEDKNGNIYKVKTRIAKRQDITKKYIINYNIRNQSYDNSGIYSEFNISGLSPSEKYKIGIQIQIGATRYFVWTNNEFIT
jgi:hypothetical protein